jgi:uracil-DNA glycosylase
MSKPNRKRSICAWGARIALVVATLGLCPGCNEDEALQVFRDSAAENLKQGLSTIVDGILEGTFAVVQMGDDAATREEQEVAAEGGG